MVLEPILGLLASVFGIIVLLEDDALRGPAIKCKAVLQIILQNLDVKVPIHPPINLASISNLLEQHTAPNHQISFSKASSIFLPVYYSTCLGPFLNPHLP